jgi:site-specific DNA recombinase
MSEKKVVVAIYCRVSSDDQRNRETIKTQQDVAESYLAVHYELEVYRWYIDDGISGTIPMSQRPEARSCCVDAAAGAIPPSCA